MRRRVVWLSPRWGRSRRAGVLPALLAAAAVFVGCRILIALFVLFQHAYLNTYWFVPGWRISASYWQAIRFAFHATVMVSIGIGLVFAIGVLELVRAVRR